MKQIRLLCITMGLAYGSTVDVGSEVGQIKQEDAEALIKEGHAVEIKPSIDGTKETLKAELETLKAELETLKAENEALKAELETLKQKAVKGK